MDACAALVSVMINILFKTGTSMTGYFLSTEDLYF